MRRTLLVAGLLGAVLLMPVSDPEATELRGVEVLPGPAATEVMLRFSSLPDYSYSPGMNPFRVIVRADATAGRERFPGARGGVVTEVTAAAAAGGGCRIQVLLSGFASFEVTERGADLLIRLVPEAGAGVDPFPVPDFSGSAVRDIRSIKVRRIAVDAGHGGLDPGASYYGTHEKDIVLAVAQKLASLINARGRAEAFLTRTGDYYIPLRERPLIANQYRADLFVSLHANANTNKAHSGSEIYFCSEEASDKMAALVAERENKVIHEEERDVLSENAVDIEEILFRFERKLYWEDSRQVSGLILDQLASAAGTRNRGVHSANFSVLRNAKMPAILVEVGFLSNRNEAGKLLRPAFQQRVAEGIYNALETLMP